MARPNKQQGFTLIELMIVIAILSLLGVVTIPRFTTLKSTAADEASLIALNQASKIYGLGEKIETEDVFEGLDTDAQRLQALVDNDYMEQVPVPRDESIEFKWNIQSQEWVTIRGNSSGGTTFATLREAVADWMVGKVRDEIKNATPTVNNNYKFYNTMVLASDNRYFAAMNPMGLRFFDATQPDDVQQVADIWVMVNNGQRMPQAMTSIGDYIYLATTNGYFYVFDWSDRENPVKVASLPVSAGQNFDISSNNHDTVFIANTDSKAFIAVSVADPLTPSIVYQDNTLNGYGAGVAYYQGHAYAAGYNGTLYAYAKDGGGQWGRTVAQGVGTIAGASRLEVVGDCLYVHAYSGNTFDIFSLADPSHPVKVSQLVTARNLSTYAKLVRSGDYLYVGLSNPGEIVAYDIRNPANPIEAFSIPFAEEEKGGILGMSVSENGWMTIVSSIAANSAVRSITVIDDPAEFAKQWVLANP